ncbi:hypothetical protein QWY93_19545 [Echinicola jeungdonensis]|nr:hypothetical protein [Echinicola jeungdonensis]MDN3671447.1 hypothetical protein [Echinicola jeungdonensis]
MAEKKQKIKEERIKRYESFSDEELLKNLTGFERRMPPFPSKWT